MLCIIHVFKSTTYTSKHKNINATDDNKPCRPYSKKGIL